MGKLIRFLDNGKACWSRVDWENGEPAFISIANSGIMIKRSNLGIMGAKLYNERDIHQCVAVSRVLDDHLLIDDSLSLIPADMTGAVLISFTRLAIGTKSASEFCARIGDALRLVNQGH